MTAMPGLIGTTRLTRLALRRDRFTLPAWILGLAGFTAATTAMIDQSFPTYQDLVQDTELVATNPGLRMLGLASGPTVGAYTMHRDYVTLAVLAGLMSTLAVVRHTRQNEELGRAEMLGSAVVGRYAGLAAAVIVSLAANVVLAVLLGLAMMTSGQPAAGSFAAGAAVAAVGVAFVGVAAVTSQLSSTTRGATGAAGGALALAFLASGIGNMLGEADSSGLRVTSAWPAWLSPVGWGQQIRPFGGNHLWPLLLFGLVLVGLVAVAVVLAGRRDVGRGLMPERRGHATASASLLSHPGLVLRLQRGALIGWAVGLLAFGLIFGALSEQIQDIKGEAREWYTQMGGSDQILDAYRTSIVQMAGMAVAIYAVQMLLRLRADEVDGTLEPILATGVSRSRWVLGHVLNTLAGSVLLLVVFAVAAAFTAGQVIGDSGEQLSEMVAAALVQLPGIMALGAAVVAVVGLLPRWAVPVSWAMLVAALMIGPLFGPSLGLPVWMQDISPFTHIPNAPAADVTAAPLVGLAVACLALGLCGLAAIRRRNLLLPA
jgi:ABC-2 type transport system permease protein